MRISSLVFILFLTVMYGCVGTVMETDPENTLKIENPPTTFTYGGITTARAISHNKIEIEFYPVNDTEVKYRLYVNNADTPITIDPQSLYATNGGRLLYTIDNLQTDREYKLKLRAYKADSSVSDLENEVFVRTFDNVTANFSGVSKVTVLPGNTSGGIKIDWIAPAMTGIFTSGPYDPVHYEISLISSVGGAPNLNNSTYGGSDKIVRMVPTPPARANPLSNPNSTTVEGLMPNTLYYVQVRAINTLWMNYYENPDTVQIPVAREVNTRYLTVRTEPNDSLFDFNQSTVVLANATGSDAFDKIDVFWQPGSGNFTGYRVFARKYTGVSSASADDQLTDAVLQSMNSSGDYTAVASSLTSRRITGLENGAYYQVKVALCKTVSCPVQSTHPDAAIISDLVSIQVKPTLAPFSGIHSIVPPGQYNEINNVTLKFDAPLVTLGYATNIEFFCVDPLDKTQMVKFNGTTPISGSGIARCNGLSLVGTIPALESYTSQKVTGLNNNGTTEYCFAAGPAIIGYGADVRLNSADMIVRCGYPEAVAPTVAQFPGISGSCELNGMSGKIRWALPAGGIYSNFKVFWKLKKDSEKFSFADAIGGSTGYSSSALLSAATVEYTIPNLMPGEIYQMGVLSSAIMATPPDLYSEFNLHVIDCAVPLPVATFKGFTRIFAVGPKLDARIPNDPTTKTLSTSSALYEAINADGTPFEVAMASMSSPDLSANFTPPPGRDVGASFGALFDGAPNENGAAVSNSGIISLAWEEPEMSYADAQTLFVNNQPAVASPRADRKWGYRIYRSSDNKLTWQELTLNSGLIYSMPYTYRRKPTAAAISTRMAFFTDYSVKALYDVHDATNGRDIDRARIYYYKIIPIFNGKSLTYASASASIAQVTLPPPNMALVHRWMANRAGCMELEKTPNVSKNYTCSYNGLGARPASYPHRVGNTVFDQKGDLLVDRNELGCRYTRGENTALPELSASSFYLPSAPRRNPNDTNWYPLFRGFRSVGETEDPTTPFRGCVGDNSRNLGATGTGDDYPTGFSPSYKNFLQGDCLGAHSQVISQNACPSNPPPHAGVSRYTYRVPGASLSSTLLDCSVNTPSNPTYASERFSGVQAPNYVMQSEFLGVYYNTDPGEASLHPTVMVPSSTSIESEQNIATISLTGYDRLNASSCSINLAAIDGDGYMKPRWADLNLLGTPSLNFKGTVQSLITKTVAEISEVQTNPAGLRTLYNGVQGDLTTAAFKLPSPSLRSSPRYRDSTRLARVLTSNGAKLPPLGRLNQDTAQQICSTYWVQTGSASESGNFLPSAAPASKRLLRKTESISASAWPEHFDDAKISSIENSNAIGSCVGSLKGSSGIDIEKGDLLTNESASYNFSNRQLLTGSSPYHGLPGVTDAIHSQSCVSRYGIQDLIGNVSENNSENIFCDYSTDQILVGPVQASWSGGSGAQNQGAGGPDLNLFNTNQQIHNLALVKSGTLADGTNVAFKIKFRDGSPDQNDVRPWVKISTDSGYCSIVDKNPDKRVGDVDFFKDVATGFWNSLYLPGGALNTTMVEKPQLDQKSVDTLRNGDARYLDFGVSGILPPLSRANTLALRGTTIAKYFNPVTGLPLACNNGSCEDPTLGSPIDNTTISTGTLTGNISDLDMSPSVGDFPLRISNISSSGVSDYTYSATGFSSFVLPEGPILNFATEVLVDDPVSLGNATYTTVNREGFQIGATIEYYKPTWNLPRNAVLNFRSGGGFAGQNGRYTAAITPNKIEDPGRTYHAADTSSDETIGARCAVLINEEP